MGSHDDADFVPFLHEFREAVDVRTGRVSNKESGREMDDRDAVFHHFFTCVLDISAGTTAAGSKSGYFGVFFFVFRKSTFPVPECPEAFTAGTGPVAVADNDTDSDFLVHACLPVNGPSVDLPLIIVKCQK